MKFSPINCIDFYKSGHIFQYPKGTNLVYSNFTARSNRLSNLPDNNDKIVFFGLQYFIKDYLDKSFNEGFFKQPLEKVLSAYKRRMDTSLGKDSVDVSHIKDLHELGYLPLEIRALPEGTKVSMGVPVLTVHNTHPKFFWLTNYIETILSTYLWLPCTSATTANWYKELLTKYAKETSSPEMQFFVDFQGHDFSYRGMAQTDAAAASGAGHLLSFVGTDTIPAIDFLEEFYNADAEQELIGCSVPATEHSVMCMGEKENEIDTFRRLITEVYPNGIVSIVSDTWDFWKVVTEYVKELKPEILARSGNPIANKVVIRPDSGDPVKIICGYGHKIFYNDDARWLGELIKHPEWAEVVCSKRNKTYYKIDKNFNAEKETTKYLVEISEAEAKGAIECLWDVFGGKVNDKGFKELDPHIGLIYGDSITPQRAKDILEGLKQKGFASTNVVFGIGSYTYQYVTRDTYGFAVKSTYGEVNGNPKVIFKDPVTDSGVKKSAKGLLKVIDGKLIDNVDTNEESELQTVFKDGKYKETTLNEIRNRLASN